MGNSGEVALQLPKMFNALTPKQQAFVREYIKDGNAEAAVRRAGYSDNNSRSHGTKLVSSPKIKPILDELMRARASRALVNADRLVQELCEIAFSDVGNYVDSNGLIKDLADIPPHQRRAIKSLKPTKYGIAIELHNKDFALGMLAKHLGPDFAPSEVERMRNVTPGQGPVLELPADGSSE